MSKPSTLTAFVMVLVLGITQFMAPSHVFVQLENIDEAVSRALPFFGGDLVVAVGNSDGLLYYRQEGRYDSLSKQGVASATKLVSGLVVLKLAELGYFRLDDSLGRYLPRFSQNGKGHLTIRQCFSMSSGLFDTTSSPGGISTANSYEINRRMTLQESADSIAVYIPVIFQPGTRTAYDGAQMQAVGALAERVVNGTVQVGQPGYRNFESIARDLLFAPLAMDSTDYRQFGDLNPAIAGGMRTTPKDYIQLLLMLVSNGRFNGQQILAERSIAELFIDQNSNAPIFASPWLNSTDPALYPPGIDTVYYGFGSWILNRNVQTNRITEICSPGAFGTVPWLSIDSRFYALVFTNRGIFGSRTFNSSLRILEAVRQYAASVTSARLEPQREGQSNAHIRPNPVSQSATTLIDSRGYKTIQIFTMHGERVHTIDVGQRTEVPFESLAHMSPGTYLVRADGLTSCRWDKLIVLP